MIDIWYILRYRQMPTKAHLYALIPVESFTSELLPYTTSMNTSTLPKTADGLKYIVECNYPINQALSAFPLINRRAAAKLPKFGESSL